MNASNLIAALILASTEGGGSSSPLEFKTDLAFWTAVVFLGLLAILWWVAWKPIAEGLEKRENHISDQIANAETANQKAKDMLAGYEQKLADAGNEVRGILEQGRRDAERLGRQLIEKSKEQAEAERARAVQQIEAAADAAAKNLADRSATLAVELAGKIVHAKLKPADHARLIEQAVAGFVKGKSDPSRN
jgi:F-type H+-transporting ATPase subunit b